MKCGCSYLAEGYSCPFVQFGQWDGAFLEYVVLCDVVRYEWVPGPLVLILRARRARSQAQAARDEGTGVHMILNVIFWEGLLTECLYGYRKFFRRRRLRLCDDSLGLVLGYVLANSVRCRFNNE